MTDSRLPTRYKPGSTLKHGLYSKLAKGKIDGRTQVARSMKMLRDELVKHCGGSPSITEKIIIQRIVAKSLICHLYETGVLSNPTKRPGSRDHYLACSNSLRLDIALLGLKSKQAEKIPNLDDYLKTQGKDRESK